MLAGVLTYLNGQNINENIYSSFGIGCWIRWARQTIFQDFTNEIEDDPWWDWCAVFALCSVLSVCLIVGLLFIVTKFFSPLKEKDVIKFSSQKTRDGWYSDNLLATEQRTNGHCHLTEKDFIVVWSWFVSKTKVIKILAIGYGVMGYQIFKRGM